MVLVSIFPWLINGIFLLAQSARRFSFFSFLLSLTRSLRGIIPDTTTPFFFDLIDEARLAISKMDYCRIRFELYCRNYIALHAFRFSTRYWFYKNVTLIIWITWSIDIFNHRISRYSNCSFWFKLLVVFSTFSIEAVIFPKVIPVGSDVSGLSCYIISIMMVAIMSDRVSLIYIWRCFICCCWEWSVF